jgi:hypothetical protein
MLFGIESKPMSNVATLKSLAAEMRRLQERIEDMKTLSSCAEQLNAMPANRACDGSR